MTRHERKAYVQSLVADIIGDGLEQAYFEGKITDTDEKFVRRWLGYHFPDLKPQKITPVCKLIKREGVKAPCNYLEKIMKKHLRKRQLLG